ncbi:MAG: hypothetical protein Q8N69_02330, partial [bacterium]|nr:hypothetical protein [bacterium]
MSKVFAKKALVCIALLAFFIIPFLVSAQDLEVDYPTIRGEQPTIKTGLPGYVKYVFTFFIAAAGLIVFSVLIWGGWLYLTSTGNVSKMKEAKEKIFSAFLGITILFGSYIILRTINPQLVLFDFPDLPGISIKKTNPPPDIAIPGSSLISSELPLVSAMTTESVWNEDRTKKLEGIIISLENFLNKETKLDDPELNNDVVKSIASLNKYLQSSAAECRCENLITYAAKPEAGGGALGHLGDPCQIDQDAEIEPDSPRGKINKALALNAIKTEI